MPGISASFRETCAVARAVEDMTEDEGAKEKAGRLEVKKYSSIFEISFLGSTMALLSLQMW